MKDEKLTVIGSKSYEECQCVMLPTDKASKLYIAGNNLFNYEKERENGIGNCQNQHLYILSSEEIKEGDWCLTGLKIVRQCNGFTYSQNGKTLNGYTFNDGTSNTFSSCKKIIATTNESLKVDCNQIIINCDKSGYDGRSVCNTCKGSAKLFLPRPSDDFLKAFVKAQGVGFDKVLIEYFEQIPDWEDDLLTPEYETILKVSRDNTITIKSVQQKESWTREEVIKLIYAHGKLLYKQGFIDKKKLDKWIKENL